MKTYIGDGVSAEIDEYGRLTLTTENGFHTTNKIILEPEVWRALLDFSLRERLRICEGQQ